MYQKSDVIAVQRLQGLTTLLSKYSEEISLLAVEIRHTALIATPHSAAVSAAEEAVAREDGDRKSGQDSATKVGVEMFIKDLGIAAADIYHLLPDKEQTAVVARLARYWRAYRMVCTGLLSTGVY
jgi:hypothetical protein